MIWPDCGQADCDEIVLQKNQLWCHFSDVIAIASAKWRYQNNITKFIHL